MHVRIGAALAALALALGVGAVPGAAQERTVDAERVHGATRYDTAAAAALLAAGGQAATVVLASGADFPDALAAAPLAGATGGALLLTQPDALPAPTAEALEDLGATQVLLLGGSAAVSDAVAAELRARGLDVRRLAGATRYATAAAAAREAAARGSMLSRDAVPLAFVAGGTAFADAVVAGAPAAAGPAPVLLTRPHALPEETAGALRDLGIGAVDVIGGAVARAWTGAGLLDERVATLARGDGFADALAAGPLAGAVPGPVLLAEHAGELGPHAAGYLAEAAVELVRAVGGTAAISHGVLDAAVRAAGGEPAPVEVVVDVVATGLAVPWEIAFAGQRVFVTERDTGNVLELTGGQRRVVTRLAVDAASEGGLLGLAASPHFAQDGLLYTYRTTTHDNEVLRFPVHDPARVEIVVDGIPAASIHNGGRLAFGPDGMLYVGTGDAGRGDLAQQRGSLAGKVLRVTPGGGVPSGNPFPGSPVWTLGHRNVQGLAFAGDGSLYATELGPDRDDEVNALTAGGNYGWPLVTGQADDSRFRDPIFVRQPSEASWSGAAVLTGGAIPQWEGDLFAAGLRGRRLWRVPVSGGAADAAAAEALLAGEFGRLRAVAQAPDGSLWVATNNTDGRGSPGPQDDRIVRLRPRR